MKKIDLIISFFNNKKGLVNTIPTLSIFDFIKLLEEKKESI